MTNSVEVMKKQVEVQKDQLHLFPVFGNFVVRLVPVDESVQEPVCERGLNCKADGCTACMGSLYTLQQSLFGAVKQAA